MSYFINPADNKLIENIKNLKNYPGYCVFMDIVGSTELKDIELPKWIIYIYNTFANTKTYFWNLGSAIKSIGDSLMFYFPENSLKDEDALSIFAGLASIAKNEELHFKDVKISVTYCSNVYDITFIENTKDVYGKDIDLTARLLSIASSKEIIMNEEFVKRLKESYNRIGNKEQFPEVDLIVGPWPQKFKGFKQSISVYKLP